MRTYSFVFERALVLVAVSLGCARVNDVPDPPDVSSIVAAYEHPDGVVDAEAVVRELPVAVAIARGIAESGIPEFVNEILSTVRDSADDRIAVTSGSDLQSSDVHIDALLRVRRVCNGLTDDSAPADPARNGQLDLRAVVRGNKLQPTVWGSTIGRCIETVTVEGHAERLFFDGGLTLHPHGKDDATVLVRVDGRVGVRDHELASAFDFRLVNRESVELRARARGGWIVFYLSPDRFGVRGSNGDFTCSLESHVCRRVGGGSVRW